MLKKKALNTVVIGTLTFLIFSGTAFAHNVFTEIPLHVGRGEELTFKSFFSDPDDPIDQRDMCDLSMQVRLPDGQVMPLEMEQHETFYLSRKLFDQEGEYVFMLEREPYQHRTTQIRDFGKSIVWTTEERPDHSNVGFPLEISLVSAVDKLASGSELEGQVLYEGEPLPEAEIRLHTSLEPGGRVYDPDYPRIVADKNGVLKLSLDRDYNYILEVRHTVSASDVDFDTSLLTRNIRFRTTLYVPSG